MKKVLVIALIFWGFNACDMFYTDDDRLVGNIVLINPHNQDVHGYRMVIYEGDINSNVLEEDIVKVDGNDTILVVIGRNENGESDYYNIKHLAGKKIISTKTLTSEEYLKILSLIKIKYSFSAE